MTLQLDRPLVVLDTETTGVDPEIDRIVQIGIVLVSRDHERQEWEFYIDPEEPIPPEATEIHGISDVIVQGKPPFVQIWPLIAEIIDGADIVAYNARFDLAMIDAELKRAALPKWDRSGVRVIDPLVIFRARHPHTLEGACKEYGVGNLVDAHDALADARATLMVLERMLGRYDWSLADAIVQSVPPPDDRYCDSGRKFYWRFGRPHHATGKHRGKPIEHDLGYLEWMVSARGIPDLPADTLELIHGAIDDLKVFYGSPPK